MGLGIPSRVESLVQVRHVIAMLEVSVELLIRFVTLHRAVAAFEVPIPIDILRIEDNIWIFPPEPSHERL